MAQLNIFLDTPILRESFIKMINNINWRSEFNIPSNSILITAHKCVAEMYGILKTNILDKELSSYGLTSSKKLRDLIFGNDDFLNIFWHQQANEVQHTRLSGLNEINEYNRNLQSLIKWRTGYEKVRQDFDKFLKKEDIEIINYGSLFNKHEWQSKFDDLAIETLIPSEDLEIVLSAWYAEADLFLTKDNGVIKFSFSLPLEPGVPIFCNPENIEQKLLEKQQGIISYPFKNSNFNNPKTG